LHSVPQAQTFCALDCWQPQVQVDPGHAGHWHFDWVLSFMVLLLKWVERAASLWEYAAQRLNETANFGPFAR
jgi:hypothetical protein